MISGSNYSQFRYLNQAEKSQTPNQVNSSSKATLPTFPVASINRQVTSKEQAETPVASVKQKHKLQHSGTIANASNVSNNLGIYKQNTHVARHSNHATDFSKAITDFDPKQGGA